MEYAVFEVSGNQVKAGEGEEILVDRLEAKNGQKLKFDKVLLLVNNGEIKIGTPEVKGALVEASVLGDEKGKKLHVVKYRAKSRYRRKYGHRTQYTRLKIERISTSK